jgi:UDPglucose 6-dehydrogenase
VLGCGYVGLVTGACLAEIGHEVVCADNDEGKIRTLGQGALPIYEPHLDVLVERNVAAQRLGFATDLGAAVRFGDAIFICVGTPPLPNGDADLSPIDAAARLIGLESRSSKLVIEKSTVPVQTGERLLRSLGVYAGNSQWSFSVASNPEFLREGTAVQDFLHPDRIVIGVSDTSSEMQLREIYRPILEERIPTCPIHDGHCPVRPRPEFLVTGVNSAELIKHASNSFLALKISYANLISDMCESMNADIREVVLGMGLDPRIGPAFLRPGLGFGGFCLPKDIQAFIRLCNKGAVDVALLREAESINKKRVSRFVAKAKQVLRTLEGKTVGVLGLAFKPNTDDIRFAPAIELIQTLQEEHADVRVYDPKAMGKMRALFPSIAYCSDGYELAHEADMLMIVTEWESFKHLDWERVRSLMQRPLILDGRNLLDGDEMARYGFEYHGTGIPFAKPGKEVGTQADALPSFAAEVAD